MKKTHPTTKLYTTKIIKFRRFDHYNKKSEECLAGILHSFATCKDLVLGRTVFGLQQSNEIPNVRLWKWNSISSDFQDDCQNWPFYVRQIEAMAIMGNSDDLAAGLKHTLSCRFQNACLGDVWFLNSAVLLQSQKVWNSTDLPWKWRIMTDDWFRIQLTYVSCRHAIECKKMTWICEYFTLKVKFSDVYNGTENWKKNFVCEYMGWPWT